MGDGKKRREVFSVICFRSKKFFVAWPWVGVDRDSFVLEKRGSCAISIRSSHSIWKSFFLARHIILEGALGWKKEVRYSEWATMCQTKRKLHNQCHTGWSKMWQPSVIYLIVIVQTAGWWRLGVARRKFTLWLSFSASLFSDLFMRANCSPKINYHANRILREFWTTTRYFFFKRISCTCESSLDIRQVVFIRNVFWSVQLLRLRLETEI